MIFYIILLITIILAFSMLINYIYGSYINEFSTFFYTIIILVGMMLSTNTVADKMLDFSLTSAFFVNFLFYMIIIAIMTTNMFWVFVKNNL